MQLIDRAGLGADFTGVWERINVLGFMLWVAVLSVSLLRRRAMVPSQMSQAA